MDSIMHGHLVKGFRFFDREFDENIFVSDFEEVG